MKSKKTNQPFQETKKTKKNQETKPFKKQRKLFSSHFFLDADSMNADNPNANDDFENFQFSDRYEAF